MAIKPQDASRITEAETTAVAKAEEQVDGDLRGHFMGSGKVRVTKSLAGLNDRCREEVLRRFRQAGWTVKEGFSPGDQRDPREFSGKYWDFSAKIQQPSFNSLAHQIDGVERLGQRR